MKGQRKDEICTRRPNNLFLFIMGSVNALEYKSKARHEQEIEGGLP